MKIVFFGTPKIAVSSLEYFIKKDDIEVLAVITQPDKPSGRGQHLAASPVKLIAVENSIPVYQPASIKKDFELIEILKSFEPDFFITVAFGQILSQEVIDIPKNGTINLHASLLPKYRGANPLQHAIVNGDKTTGVTAMLTELGLDSGDMLIKKEIEITENMTMPELAEKVAQIAPETLYDSMAGLKNGNIIPTPQNDEEATHAPKFKKEDGLIDWNKPASVIHNQVRGMKPWPSTYTNFKNTVIKITETRLVNHEENIKNEQVGSIVDIIKEGIKVSTADGLILITKVQPAGKGEMSAYSWYNGARIKLGEKFHG